MKRLLTAAVLAPALWLLIKAVPPAVFYGVALLLIGRAAWEALRMLERRGMRPFTWLGVAAVAAVAWSFASVAPRYDTYVPLLAVTVATTVAAIWLRPDPARMLDTTLATLFPVLLIGLGLGSLVALRALPGEDGPDLVLLLFICVIFADTGAYYVGRTFGRRKLAPAVSPNKTWEGCFGGLGASLVGALVAHVWFYQRLPLGHALALGLVLGGAGVLGDLVESMLKRAAGVKDSSDLLPGHGGLLDRSDSLLLSGPILYHYYRLLLQGVS